MNQSVLYLQLRPPNMLPLQPLNERVLENPNADQTSAQVAAQATEDRANGAGARKRFVRKMRSTTPHLTQA